MVSWGVDRYLDSGTLKPETWNVYLATWNLPQGPGNWRPVTGNRPIGPLKLAKNQFFSTFLAFW